VSAGNNQTFTFTPTSCGILSQVLIDGVNNPAAVTAGSYTFNNVMAGHTIEAVFTMPCQYTFIANDSYGDGWTTTGNTTRDTAYLLIKQSGNIVHRLTAISRASSNTATHDTLTVYLCDGLNYELWWDAPTGNYFPDEISFNLIASNDTIVYSASGATQVNALSTTSAFHSFTTNCNNIIPPVVTTNAATNIQQTTATLNGSVTTVGSQTIAARGFKYKTAASSAWLFKTATGTTTITANVTGLTFNTNYVFKAYAVVGTDTTFGNEQPFTTLCQPYSTTQNVQICSGEDYTFPDGTTATNILSNTTHNSYFQTVAGCDSVITTNISVKTINMSITNNGTTLTANQAGATYQWLNCDSANSPISGATQQTFTPAVSGNYAVEISYNGCTKISECVAIQLTGIAKNKIYDIQVYPNPADNRLIVEVSAPFSGFIVLYEINGKEIMRHAATDKRNEINISSLAKGVYLIKIETEEGVNFGVRKIVK
jgi:hypothetical protein